MNNYDAPLNPRKDFLQTDSPKLLLLLNGALASVYFVVLTVLFPHGHPVLFALLVGGQIFHMWQVLTFLYTIWDTSYEAPKDNRITPPVDVFITVAGEPVELVRETVRAARDMDYPHKHIHILNDGLVAKKENWRDIERMAAQEEVSCITRTVPGGAKAGNINNALRLTHSPLVAIFDADHVPHRDFLRKTVPYFADESVAFVQTPQFYKNFAQNYLTQGAWEQQELFFGPICRGKNRLNAATMCGTNMVIARDALVAVGGMCTESIAEDFVTGLFMHEKGYTSVYVPEVLAEGLAAEDFLSYSKQQFRWARGALDVIFRYNPLFRSGLSWAQRIQYLASASFFLSGAVVLLNAMLPIIFFYTGAVPVIISGMLLASVFLPYIFLTLYTLQRSSNHTFTFPSIALSMSAFTIHLRALWAALTMQKSAFAITSKEALTGNYLRLATAHILYIVVALFGIVVAFAREGLSASLINNSAWALFTIAVFVPFIRSSLPQRSSAPQQPVTTPAPRYANYSA
jgi:cellulose synthase (UDP-forming)